MIEPKLIGIIKDLKHQSKSDSEIIQFLEEHGILPDKTLSHLDYIKKNNLFLSNKNTNNNDNFFKKNKVFSEYDPFNNKRFKNISYKVKEGDKPYKKYLIYLIIKLIIIFLIILIIFFFVSSSLSKIYNIDLWIIFKIVFFI